MISVLVPVYNTERYLRRCIDSILEQTFGEFEIILLDDGSIDSSGSICDIYASRDRRISVIHTDNCGIGVTRNRLIESAKYEYICFVDSDDYIQPEMLEILYKNLIYYKADISLCGTRFVFPQKTLNNSQNEDVIKVYKNEEAIFELVDNWRITCSPCDKLYKAKLFKDVRYPSVPAFEDMMIAFQLFNNCNKIVYDGHVLYNYVKTPYSLLRSRFNKDHLVELEARRNMTENIGRVYPNMIPKLEINELNTKLYVCNRIIAEAPELVDVYDKLSAELKSNYKRIVLSEYVCLKSKVLMTVMIISSGLYKACIRKIKNTKKVSESI